MTQKIFVSNGEPQREITHKGKTFRVSLTLPAFIRYIKPLGFLTDDLACHALMYYALTARNTYEQITLGRQIQYEGDPEPEPPNYKEMFVNIAGMYGVPPEAMAQFWPNIDMQFVALNIPQLPKEERFRFNKPLVIN